MMNDVLETIDLEVRIAAAKAVRDRVQTAAGQDAPGGQQPEVVEALTDALIDLRTKQVEKLLPHGSEAEKVPLGDIDEAAAEEAFEGKAGA